MLQPPDVVQAKEIVDNARYRSRWTAILTSMHTTALYESWRGTDDALDRFLDEQQNYQRKLARSLAVPIQRARDTYQLMYFCDALSLILCKDQIPPEGLHLEVTQLPLGETAEIYTLEDESYQLSPWPWEDNDVILNTEVYRLKQLSFKNDQELYEAFDQADISIKKWRFLK